MKLNTFENSLCQNIVVSYVAPDMKEMWCTPTLEYVKNWKTGSYLCTL